MMYNILSKIMPDSNTDARAPVHVRVHVHCPRPCPYTYPVLQVKFFFNPELDQNLKLMPKPDLDLNQK